MSLDDQHEIIVMEDKRPKLTMPESQVSNTANGAVTAPCCIEDSGISSLPPRERTFSFNSARQTAKCQRPRTKRLISRQNTVSGDSSIVQFSRALSRTYTIGSNASSSIPMEEWKPIFDKLDLESDGVADGKIPVDKFKSLLEDDPLWSETVPNDVQVNILDNVDRNQDGVIDYEEFLDLVKGKKFGFGRKRRRAFRELLKETIEFIVPYKYSYQNQYSCSPPPLFMIFMSLLQIAIFTYNSYQIGFVSVNGPVQYCSSLIYNPNKRYQIWRFLTYMVIHSGIFHLVFNVLVQLILGIPLEMVHGWWRVLLVYVFGVVSGSLWTSVLRPNVFLSGASGGVYALITAHLGTVIMNFREMSCPWCRVIVVILIALTDISVYVYDLYIEGSSNPVSYPAHISGSISGLLVGITVLKNLHWQKYERYIWYVSIFIFVVLMLIAILWNLIDSNHFVGVSVDIPCAASEKVL